MVVVDRLTKVAHFIPMESTRTEEYLGGLYIDKIVKLHGILKEIVLSLTGIPYSYHMFGRLPKEP